MRSKRWVLLVAGFVLASCSSTAAMPSRSEDSTAPAPASTITVLADPMGENSPNSGDDALVTANGMSPPRVLLVGDSTLLAVESYGTERALTGFDAQLEVASCRTIGVRSCGRAPVPLNTVETIQSFDESFDAVVVMAGYDEFWTSFPDSFDEAIDASRGVGAETIIWLNYTEGVSYLDPNGTAADETFVKNNATLVSKAADGSVPELIIADWNRYSDRFDGWLTRDGIHLTPTGSLGVADYISRHVASSLGRPCPQPLVAGGEVDSSKACANPDEAVIAPDVESLYAG